MTGGTGQKREELRPDTPSQRVIFAFRTVSLVVVAIGVFWGIVSLYVGHHGLAAIEAAFALSGMITWLLVSRGKIEAALIFAQAAFLVAVVFFCLVFDVPSSGGPRVSHLYLLALAALGYVSYVRRKSLPQAILVGGCIAAFVALASSNASLPFAEPIPDEMRAAGTWINVILATTMLCGCIHVLQLEFSGQKGLARDLQHAIRHGGLELYYQPQVDEAGRVIGAEALLRWNHPQRGQISPAVFIPVAEESGLMPNLGGWVLRNSCAVLQQWSTDPMLSRLSLAVNVSARQFMDDDFEQTVREATAVHDIDPRRMKLELTESVMISGIDSIVAKMEALRAAGFRFALDDFGTGYSSLSYLRQLPIDELKIDRSFVQEGLETSAGMSLVRSIIQMGLDMGLVVLAEGIETRQQYEVLLDCGCQKFQGYHFGRPVPRDVFEDFARAADTRDHFLNGALLKAGNRARAQRSA